MTSRRPPPSAPSRATSPACAAPSNRAAPPARPARVLASEAPGYLLRVERDTIDLFRFESLADEGRRAAEAGDIALALDRFDEALALWRGPALAGLAGEVSVEAVIVRLEEGRTAVVEDRFDAELALGRHGAVIGRLQEAVAEQPLRERLWGQLALAQYRAGRQADAVRTLATARTTLGEELGPRPRPRAAAPRAADPQPRPGPRRWRRVRPTGRPTGPDAQPARRHGADDAGAARHRTRQRPHRPRAASSTRSSPPSTPSPPAPP